jgi:suppressor for copper-sensitivity B
MNRTSKIIKFLISIILFTFYFNTSFALSSEWAVGETSKLRLISPYSQNSSKNITIGLEYQMQPGWKTYWKSPGDGGFAQNISWENSSNISDVKILWPTPIKFEILGLTSLGYQDNVTFPLEIEIENEFQDINLDLHVNYLICKEICIPGDARIFLDIPAGEKKINDNYFDVEQALSKLPEKDFSRTYLKNINANVLEGENLSTIRLQIESEKIFFNPEIFLHTPFGLPVVQHTISYSANNKLITAEFDFNKKLISEDSFPLEVVLKDVNHNFEHLLSAQITKDISNSTMNTFIFYILISLLAGLILNVMPCVFPILSIKLMSVFTVDQGTARVSFLTVALGIVSSFFLLGICFLVLQYFNFSIAWGMQFQKPYFLIFITLIIFLFMMNMFGQFQINLPQNFSNIAFAGLGNKSFFKDFFNGFFATLMATPCSAPFVGTAITAAFTQNYITGMSIFLFMGIGMSSPYLLIALFPKLVNFLPKPGIWMIYVKYFLGLLLLATVVWLSNILLNFFNIYFLVISLFVLLVITYRRKFPLFKNTITIASIIFIFFSTSLQIFQQHSSSAEEKDWVSFFTVDIDQLVAQDKIIFLDITADWCATCQFNKINVLNSDNIIKQFKDNSVTLIRADWTKPNERVNLFLEKYDRFGIPFNAFFSKKFPDGILLSELLSEKEIVNAINKIKYE